MERIEITIEQLRCMIGLHVCHRGVTCYVLEVLEDGPSLVLQDLEQNTAIQHDQFGDPQRRVMETYVVPVLTDDRRAIHPEFLALDLLDAVC